MRLLYHGIFTNAFGRRGEGFRNLFLAPPWPSAERIRVERWLRSLDAQSPEVAPAVAVNSFRLGGTIHACLARVDAGFARDEHGRAGGVLVHALLTPLAEGKPPGCFTRALWSASRTFTRPEVEDTEKLEAYLERCRRCLEIAEPTVDYEALMRIDPALLRRFFAAAADRARPGQEIRFGVGSDEELADVLTRATALLPPRLRLACRWAVGLRTAPEQSFVARPSPEPTPEVSGGPSSAYDEWLRAHLAAGRHRDVEALTASWEVRSWDGVTEWIRRHPAGVRRP